MTESDEKLRDKLASDYVRDGDCEVLDTWGAHEGSFKAGWDAARAHDPSQEQGRLKDELSKIVTERDQLRTEVERLRWRKVGAQTEPSLEAYQELEKMRDHALEMVRERSNEIERLRDQLAKAKAAMKEACYCESGWYRSADPCGLCQTLAELERGE